MRPFDLELIALRARELARCLDEVKQSGTSRENLFHWSAEATKAWPTIASDVDDLISEITELRNEIIRLENEVQQIQG